MHDTFSRKNLWDLFMHAPHASEAPAMMEKIASVEDSTLFQPKKSFESIKQSVSDGLRDIFPIEGAKHRLVLEDLWIDDTIKGNPLRKQKEAKLQEKTYGIPVYAKVSLQDTRTGATLDTLKRVKLTDLPKLTERNTFIVGGSEWNIPTQFRLKPGVYTVFQANDLPKTQINLGAGGRGRSMEIHIDPEKDRVMFHVDTGTFPLYPLLRALGKTHEDIERAWGEKLATKNKDMFSSMEEDAVKKFAERWLDESGATKEVLLEKIREQFTQTKLDPNTTKFTLGKPFEGLNEDLLLDASAKLLRVQSGEENQDDRDHLMFKSVHGPEDIFRERFTANKRQLHFRLRRALDTKDHVRDVLAVPLIKKLTEGMFTGLSLSERSEQHNPMHIVNEANKTTLMGEGALGDLQMLKNDARSVHPSQLGIIDPIKTPESDKIGAVGYLTMGAKKEGNELKGSYVDPRTNQPLYLSAGDAHFKRIALPDQFTVEHGKLRFNTNEVKVQHEGVVKIVSPHEVDYVIPSPQAVFTFATAKTPFLNSVSGGRAFMASKHPEQALSLIHREKALVQTDVGNGQTVEGLIGRQFTIHAPVDGVVHKIEKDQIYIKEKNGQLHVLPLYDNFKLNEKSFLNHEAVVEVGQKVKKDDLLADLNFTKDGELAMGVNARVAFMVDSGKTLEDGFIVSKDFAEKMAHEQMIEMSAPKGHSFVYDKRKFSAYYPNVISMEASQKLDDRGIIQKGATVLPGDPLFLLMRKQEDTSEDRVFRKLGRGLIHPLKNMAIFWEKDIPGKIVEVAETPKGYKVHVRIEKKLEEGDKLAGSYGNKGVVSEVRPSHEMPKDSDGNTIDILFNPLGIVSRINPAQVLETALGRVAEKTGERQLVRNFKIENNYEHVMDKLEKAGVSPDDFLVMPNGQEVSDIKTLPTENARWMTLEVPVGGIEKGHRLTTNDLEELKRKGIREVTVKTGAGVGLQYFHKLAKTSDTGYSARAFGEGYDLNKQPLKGGDKGSKSMDQLTEWSMLAHGSRNILREMATAKSEQSEDFWRAIQLGHQVPAPQVPFAWKKFEGMLRTAGIEVDKKGSLMAIQPTRDKDILAISSGEISDPKMLRGKGLKEHRGGLFDPELTGGIKGNKWTHMTLAEPIPNPIFKDPVKKLTGINDKQWDKIIEGEMYVGPDGSISNEGHAAHASDKNYLTGGPAIERLLKKVNLDQVYDTQLEKAKKGKGSDKNSANRALRYVAALKEMDRRPEEAYMTQVVPIMPPEMRPVYGLESGDLGVSPVNYLYRDLGLVNNQLKEAGDLDDDLKENLRRDLYRGFEALVGTTQNRSLTRPVKGILSTIAGDNPKAGFFQSKILRKQQDLAARGVAIPNPSLDINEVGIPIKMGMQLFKPFMIQKMIRTYGMSMKDALSRLNHAKKKHDPLVHGLLASSMKERPILLNRAPSLHKYSIQAFYAKPTQGKSIQTNTLIHKGFNLDHDGDALNVHVPVTVEAVRDAERMLPSQIFRSPSVIGDGIVDNFTPMHMSQHGIWLATKKDGKDRSSLSFGSIREIEEDVAQNKIQVGDIVSYQGMKHSAGHFLVNDSVPEKYRDYDAVFDGKFVKKLLDRVSREDKEKAANIASRLQKVGDLLSGKTSLTIFDTMPVKDSIRDEALKEMQYIASSEKNRLQASKKLLAIVEEKIAPTAERFARKIKSNYMQWIDSGATSKKEAVVQQLSGPTIITDFRKEPIPVPVMKSYSEGLSVSDYFNAQYGARGGMVGRALSTAEPGYLNKLILNSSGDQLILGNDCGDKEGVEMSVDDPQAVDRFEVRTHHLTTSEYLKELQEKGQSTVRVRSPMTCKNGNGICKMCYGPNEDGQLYEEGTNIGAIAGQGVGEPLTQASMRAFHSGGAVWKVKDIPEKSTRGPQGFARIKQLISMPNEPAARAVLAKKDGNVDAIERAAAGGYEINIGGTMHKTTPGLAPNVSVGEFVRKGHVLTEGAVDPRESLETMGLRKTQDLLRDTLYDAYGEKRLKKKNFEVVVRGMTNFGTVLDAGTNPSVQVGDTVSLSQLVYDHHHPIQERIAEEAIGLPLSAAQYGLREGHILSMDDMVRLSGKKVQVKVDRVKVKPEFFGVNSIPQKKEDWLSALGQERIIETLSRGSAMRKKTNIHGNNPLAAYAYGAEFGKGPDGRY